MVRTDKGKEFPNKYFQELLRDKGMEFLVYKNSDIKFEDMERARRTIRNK